MEARKIRENYQRTSPEKKKKNKASSAGGKVVEMKPRKKKKPPQKTSSSPMKQGVQKKKTSKSIEAHDKRVKKKAPAKAVSDRSLSHGKSISLQTCQRREHLEPDSQSAKQEKPVRYKHARQEDSFVQNLGIAKLVIVSMVLAAVMMTVVFSAMRFRVADVTDSSMETTLFKSQKVLFDKKESVSRYDLVVANINSKDRSEQYIRRVIGMPGDSIWVDGSTVFINHALTRDVSLSPQTYASQLPAGTYSLTVNDKDVLNELRGAANIPTNRYLLLSDDFRHTADSRKFGLVNQNHIEGVAVYRIWPFSQLGNL